MSDSYDVVLIGAGHNTLACALHLAAKGWKTGLFEAAPTPGGAVKTGEYTLPGFRHDWAAMNLNLFAGSAFYKDYSAELAQHGCAFTPVSKPFASAFPDGSWLGVTTDRAETLARIRAEDPADAETWSRLNDSFPQTAEAIGGLLSIPMKFNAIACFMFKMLRRNKIGGSLDIAQFMAQTPRRFLTRSFRSEKMQALLGAWGLHLDYAPDVAGGGIFPYLEGMVAQNLGMTLGQGGADTIIRAMVKAIEARGGRVECNASVAKILHENGKASGIELADGRRIAAKKAVIAGVAPQALLRMTGPTESRFDQAMRDYAYAPGTMMIHLAMDSLPDWAAGAALQEFAYIHLAPSLDQQARVYQQAQAGLLPDEPILVVGQPTTVDPSRAPQGKHVLWVQVRMVPGQIKGDAAGQITAKTWDEATAPMAERALDILERYAPGTRAKILEKHVVSPLDLEAENPNLVGGDQVCGSHHISQNFMFRPARGHSDGSTALKNLHLTGAAVWPGAGTGAGPGYLLARRLAK
ncbi:NAD(P)/FAD-dependent oxidoreductase [Xinfangfangia sp. D13-10-4-6]|uniref:phytoene desaturase family protein n=1 Tax=Pseudogemmobacter hezensis TaxID=2737662 RepID=UPI001554F992|nr:NAD(P)/FAD-dependent oxidoreductase [Pseudogemmobacter hezensis]NPD14845.1 NAD(P)/FAD-dependent oxidoreductase [Pseudogemmobacter hezensis]